MHVNPLLPLELQPEVELFCWQVFEVDGGTHHFAGRKTSTGSPRVSSEIKTFDLDSMQSITDSGRLYKLKGPPGVNQAVVQWVQRWCQQGLVTEFKLVTDEYWPDSSREAGEGGEGGES